MSDDELTVTYRHNNQLNVDVAMYDGEDIATLEAMESGVRVTYGTMRQKRTREFESIEAAKIWIVEHTDDLPREAAEFLWNDPATQAGPPD
jgi:hypothetical protein